MAERTSITETSRVAATVERALDNSRVVTALHVPFREGSRPSRAVQWLGNVVRDSALFRWFTAEPDPDVIVIDLRETWTVAPIIAVLDWLAPHAARAWDGSVARTSAERSATAFRAAPVQLASALLLGVLVVQFAISWSSASNITLAGLCFLTAFAIVGLRIDWTWDEFVDSKVGKLATALFVPPEPPNDEN